MIYRFMGDGVVITNPRSTIALDRLRSAAKWPGMLISIHSSPLEGKLINSIQDE